MEVVSVTVSWCIEQLLNTDGMIEGWAVEDAAGDDEFAHLFGSDDDPDDQEYEWVAPDEMTYAAQTGPHGETLPDFTWTQEQYDLHEQGWRWFPRWSSWWHVTEDRWNPTPGRQRGG